MDKEYIHILRKQYNDNVTTLDLINKRLNMDMMPRVIQNMITPLEEYKTVKTEMGKVCNICGMNKFERKIIYAEYERINKKFEQLFHAISKMESIS